MPHRIVIHAGFHKTGTSTIQQTLKLNRPVLRKVLRSVLRPGMRDVVSAARGFSGGGAFARSRFYNRFGSLLMEQPDMPDRTLCLSAEELSGHMPGRPRTQTYDAAITLAEDMGKSVKLIYPKAELVFYYSTRAPESWLESAYWEHVKASNMKLDLEEFIMRNRAAADLDRIVDLIAKAVPADVVRARLEDSLGQRLGPATRLLDACRVPKETQARMTPPPRANTRLHPDILNALLEANRTIRDKVKRRAIKDDILQNAEGKT